MRVDRLICFVLFGELCFGFRDVSAGAPTLCMVRGGPGRENTIPRKTHFVDATREVGIGGEKQCEVKTSPNCLFDSWDGSLNSWSIPSLLNNTGDVRL